MYFSGKNADKALRPEKTETMQHLADKNATLPRPGKPKYVSLAEIIEKNMRK